MSPTQLGSSANSSFWICSRLCSPLSRRVVIYDMQGPYWLPDLVARGSWNELEMNIMPQLIVCIILHLIPHFSLPWNSIDQSCLCESTIWEGYCHSIPLFDLFSQAEARGWAWLSRSQPKEQKKTREGTSLKLRREFGKNASLGFFPPSTNATRWKWQRVIRSISY